MQTKKYPYKFLDPYTREDKELFKGRDEEIEALYQMTFESDLILVYGASGTGKTSLIQCGLANKFQSYDWLAIYIRRGRGINQSLDKLLCEQSGGEFEMDSLKNQQIPQLNEKMDSVYLNAFRPIYLIFDQFEELYILGTKEEQNAFIENVKILLEVEQPVKMIFSIREEYLGYLYEFERAIPQLLQKKLRIEPMNLTKVQAVIKGTTNSKNSNITLAAGELPTFTQAIFEFLQGKKTANSTKRLTIELPYLQVLLDKLYLNLTNDDTRQTPAVFSQTALNNLGAIDDVLRDFLEEQVVMISQTLHPTFPTINADAIWKILSPFVTLEGTKEPIAKETMQIRIKNTTTENAELLTTALIAALTKSKIIRSLEGEATYEIAHDALAVKIAEKRTDEEIAVLQIHQLIKSQLVINKTGKVLFTEEQFEKIAPFLEKLILEKGEQKLIADSKKEIEEIKKAKEIAQTKALKAAQEQAEKEKKLKRQAIYIAWGTFFLAVIGIFLFIYGIYARILAESNLGLAESNLFRAALMVQHSDEKPLFEEEELSEGTQYDLNKIIYENIDTLSFKGWGLETILKGVLRCDSLIFLDLSNNNFTDYSFLEKLPHLQGLNLSNNTIEDYSFLEKLPHLQFLDISYNQISYESDMSVLKKLTNLKYLNFNGNSVSINFLDSLTKLQHLEIQNTYLEDKEVLGKLIDLQHLNLGHNYISNISFIEKLPNLEYLDLSFNEISNINSLKNLAQIEFLDISYNYIDTLELKNLRELKKINVSGNGSLKIVTIKGLSKLKKLNLEKNEIEKVNISDMPALEVLNLSRNFIKNDYFLSNLENLDSLDLSDNEIVEVKFSGKLSNLRVLNLYNNEIVDVKFLAKLPNLSVLELRDNWINHLDLQLLEKLPNLEELYIGVNRLNSAKFVNNLPNLLVLDVYTHDLQVVNFLEKTPNLQYLDLGNDVLQEVNFLEKLPFLEFLNLSGEEIKVITLDQKMLNLKELSIGSNKIKNLKFLKNFPYLESFSLAESRRISDYSPLGKLNKLYYLSLRYDKRTQEKIEMLNLSCNIRFW